MLRRLTPFFITLAAVLFDTAILPVLYHGTYAVPVTVVVALCIGLLLGRMRGMLFGMVGGLLIDISSGTLGAMTFFFLLAGFLVGLLVDESNDRRFVGFRFHLRRGMAAFALFLIGEVVFCVYAYFQTASFEWVFVLRMLARSLIVSVLTMLLCPALSRVFFGTTRAHASYTGKKREVKHF